jgi:UDP-GlcNAc:undecaprenyl-phosphate/decaprenyl-phosphate GlcNAc-1-phosphate transferase
LAGSFGLSAVLTAGMKRLALRAGFVARPALDRYHRGVVPLGGGAAIFGTLTAVVFTAVVVVEFIAVPGRMGRLAERVSLNPTDFLARMNELWVIWLSAAALFVLGLWDDKRRLGPFVKLAIQCAVAIAAATFGEVRVELFIQNKVVTSILSAVWIVVIINAFNFLDNMDGASAGVAVIVSSILFTAAAFSGQILVGGLALVFVGTLLGFLVLNFPPAKIFMGDAGSLVVGFFVALLSLRTTYYHEAQSGSWYAVFLPLVVMAVPLYDFVSVTLLRISQGKSPFVGDTQHFSHRLKKHGLTDTQTVLVLYLATLCTGLGATFLYQVNLAGTILIFVQTIFILSIIAVFETTAR